MEHLQWTTQRRRIDCLVPLEKNPFGRISEQKKQQLADKIRRLGVYQIPTIDLNNELLTFNKRRHILVALGRGGEEIDVRVPNRALTDKERKEVILSDNVHEGEWDKQILEDLFADIDLEEIGIDLSGLELPDELVPSGIDSDEEQPEDTTYPIVAKFSEKYDSFIIVSDNEVDSTFIREFLALEQQQCYKSESLGRTHVINGHRFIDLIKARR